MVRPVQRQGKHRGPSLSQVTPLIFTQLTDQETGPSLSGTQSQEEAEPKSVQFWGLCAELLGLGLWPPLCLRKHHMQSRASWGATGLPCRQRSSSHT